MKTGQKPNSGRTIPPNYLKVIVGIFGILISSFNYVDAQAVKNVTATVKDNVVEIRYELEGNPQFTGYSIQLFAIFNGTSNPLKQVTGDVGEKIDPGISKVIIWNPAGELKDYRGELKFEIGVKGISAPLPLHFTKPTAGLNLRQGAKVNVEWSGGDTSESVKMTVAQGSENRIDLGNIPNLGKGEFKLPKKIQPGEYQINLEGKGGQSATLPIYISKKSVWGKVIPIGILFAAGVIYFLDGGNSSSNQPTNELPSPPNPN